MKTLRKMCSAIVILALLAGFFPVSVQSVQAAEGDVSYIYYTVDGDGTLVQHTGTLRDDQYNVVDADTTAWGSEDADAKSVTKENGEKEYWYVVNSDVTIGDRVTVNGDVHLILYDLNLTVNGGIIVNEGNTLSIYGKEVQTSTLTVNPRNEVAGIGSEDRKNCGTIIIHGGDIRARGDSFSAGIGGGRSGNGGTITIYDGVVQAYGGTYGAGIGGGNGGSGGAISVYGGMVTATGGGAGIGSGISATSTGTFSTGTNGHAVIFATGGENAAAISDSNDTREWNGVIFQNGEGKVYGSSVTVDSNFAILSEQTLQVPENTTLTLAEGMTMTNNGSIKNSGTITVLGNVSGNGTLENISTGTVNKKAQSAPSVIPSLNTRTATSITLNTIASIRTSMEYACVEGQGVTTPGETEWKDGVTFNDLKPATTYTFFVRFKENDYYHVSPASTGVPITTLPSTPAADSVTINYEDETISFDADKREVNASKDFDSSTNIDTGASISNYIKDTAQTLYVRVKASGSTPASDAAEVSIPARPAAPNVQGVNETVAGENDGKITGLNEETTYEISRDSGQTWNDVTLTGAEITGLSAGSYQIRAKATGNSFSSSPATVVIQSGQAPTYTLTVSAPTFADVTTGYAQPAAQPLTISNTGNSDASIASVTLNGDASAFILSGSDATVPAGESISSYSIQPAVGLAAGTYTATIVVVYNNGQTATDTVMFTVNEASFTPSEPSTPSQPTTPSEPEEPSGPSTGDSEGWDSIRDEITDAEDGATITIDMNDETEVPAEIFEEVAGKDVTIEFDMGDGVKWEVNGADIPADANFSDLDLGVTMNSDGIPVDVINAITGEVGTVQITLAHDGAFGFALTLSAPLGEENAGYWANLYHYNEDAETMDFETAALIDDDGTVKLRLTHASQYAIVIDDHSHAPVTTLPFTDVDADDWFYDPVVWAYGEGLMTGTSATTFEPNTSTTRAMIVAILNRLEDGPTADGGTFTDVHDGDWYAEAVNWAASVGIVAGFEDGTFRPNAPITREQMAAILYNYAQWKGLDVSARADLSRYSDQPSPWAEDVMQWAVAEGLISGTSATTLDPQGHATRAQVASILQRFLTKA